jgi:hypothetical protein
MMMNDIGNERVHETAYKTLKTGSMRLLPLSKIPLGNMLSCLQPRDDSTAVELALS